MSWSAHKDPEQIKEHRESEESLMEKAKTLAKWIAESKHFIAFTGAGVSTSAGIPDFRGPNGVWTLGAQGKAPIGGISTLKAIPTSTHMSLVALERQGLLKFLISQNVDGLHRRSGFAVEKLAELHGNTNLESCRNCGKQYLRDFRTRSAVNVHAHETGRLCVCGGKLYDTIINFGENLPEKPLTDGFDHSEKADLCLVLGSSLTVTPAADMPKLVGKGKKGLVIVNLQTTPLDKYAALRVWGSTDDFMKLVMKNLGIEIPEWRLDRRVLVSNNGSKLTVSAVDADGTPVSLFKSINVKSTGKNSVELQKEPFELNVKLPFNPPVSIQAKIQLNFFGHYNEPSVTLDYDMLTNKTGGRLYSLNYNPFLRIWSIDQQEKGSSLTFREILDGLANLGIQTTDSLEKKDLEELYLKFQKTEKSL